MFILATTEPEKLPPTILSRCQHFRFRRLSEPEIAVKLARLCADAGVEVEDGAIDLVARAADGAMRDAESMLERLLATGEAITLAGAEDALGLPPRDRLQDMATALVGGDLAAAIATAETLYRDGFSPRIITAGLGATLREAVHSSWGAAGFELPADPNDLLRLLHALDDEEDRFVRSEDLYALELALIKTSNALAGNLPAPATAPLEPFSPQPARPAKRVEPAPAPAAPPESAPKHQAAEAPAPAAPISWQKIKTRAGAQLKAFLMPARENVEGSEITLTYGPTHRFHYDRLRERLPELEALIAEVAGPGYTVALSGPESSKKKV